MEDPSIHFPGKTCLKRLLYFTFSLGELWQHKPTTNGYCPLWTFSFRLPLKVFKTYLLGRGFHTLIKNASFSSPTNVGSHTKAWAPDFRGYLRTTKLKVTCYCRWNSDFELLKGIPLLSNDIKQKSRKVEGKRKKGLKSDHCKPSLRSLTTSFSQIVAKNKPHNIRQSKSQYPFGFSTPIWWKRKPQKDIQAKEWRTMSSRTD